MSFFSFIGGIFTSQSSIARPQATQPKSVRGLSASEMSSELRTRGAGSMSKGITRTQQRGYWQGRADQKKIDSQPK
jgi:hypothetical protein